MVQTCIFDLYGTLVDIHTDEEKPEVGRSLRCFSVIMEQITHRQN